MFCRHRLGGYRQTVFCTGTGWEAISLLGSPDLLGWASAATEPHAGSRDGNTAIECLFWDAKRDENPGLRRRRFCLGAADGLGYTTGLRRSCCDCSGDPTSRNGGLSPLKQPTTPHKICVPRLGYYVEHAVSRWTNKHVPSRREKKGTDSSRVGCAGNDACPEGSLCVHITRLILSAKGFISQLKLPIKHGKGKNGTSSAG